MKVHHLNCATICPRVPKAILGNSHLVCHCLLIESSEGLILVDTGLGLHDIAEPAKRLGHVFTKFARPRLDPNETAIRQVQRLGFRPDDVRHIVMTHLDVDHAGGISDFPHAKIHVYEPEFQAAFAKTTRIEKIRYHSRQWSHEPLWVRHTLAGETWFGFDSVRALDENLPEILLVPLLGHTRGHCGVAVQTSRGWLLHAGDAYFYHAEMSDANPHCSLGLGFFQVFMQIDVEARLENQRRLRQLKAEQFEILRLFCSHDSVELEKLQRVSMG